MGRPSLLLWRQAVGFLPQANALDEKGHVSGQSTHRLQTLFVGPNILRRVSMDHIPVLAGNHGHAGYGEILVQLIKGRRVATPSSRDNGSAHFHCLIKKGAVE